jgi:hypothetical protein
VPVTLPGAVPVVLSGLRLGLIYAMLGVIGAEIITAEHGVPDARPSRSDRQQCAWDLPYST